MVGFPLQDCNPFLLSVAFYDCKLDLAQFNHLNLKQSVFDNCSLVKVDFTNANLSESTFNHCNLKNAIFENTNLQSSDFRTAENFSISPEINQLKHAKFLKHHLSGLLDTYFLDISE